MVDSVDNKNVNALFLELANLVASKASRYRQIDRSNLAAEALVSRIHSQVSEILSNRMDSY